MDWISKIRWTGNHQFNGENQNFPGFENLSPKKQLNGLFRRISVGSLVLLFLFLVQAAYGQTDYFTTADGWVWKNPFPFGGNFRSVYMLDEDDIVAGGSYGVIVRSEDCGEHWVQSDVPNGYTLNVTKLCFIAHQEYGYAAGGGYLLATDDGGTSWYYCHELFNYHIHDVTTAGNDVLVLLSERGGSDNFVFIRNFQDDDWRLAFEPPVGFSRLTSANYPFYWNEQKIFRHSQEVVSNTSGIRDVTPVPLSNNFIFLRDSTVCFNSTDNVLARFENNLTGLCAVDHDVFYVIGYNIYRSRDGGESFQDLGNVGVRLWQTAFYGNQVGFAVGETSRIIMTINAGNFWVNSLVLESQVEGGRCVYFKNSNTGYLQTSNIDPAMTYKTINGGENWDLVSTADRSFADVNKFQYLSNEQYFFILDGNNRLYRSYNSERSAAYPIDDDVRDFFFLDSTWGWYITSTELFFARDGGVFWNSLHEFPNDSLNALFFVSTDVGYLGGNRGKVLKTTDGGQSWRDVSVAGVDVNALWFISESHGFVAADEGVFFVTTNGGITWRPKDTGTQDDLHNVRFFDVNNGYVVTSAGFIVTRDGGDNFLVYIAPLGFEVGHTQKTPSLNIIDTTFTNFVYSRDRNLLMGCNYFVNVNEPEYPFIPHSTGILSSYPNPFNNGVWLTFQIPNRDNVKAMIFDQSGRLVDTLLDRLLLPGKHDLYWRPEHLASGVYLFTIVGNSGQATKPIVLIR